MKVVSDVEYVELNIGDKILFKCNDGSLRKIKLLDAGKRLVYLEVENSIAAIHIAKAATVKGVKIIPEVTKNYKNYNRYSDLHLSIKKDARILLLDSKSRLLDGDYTFPFPNFKWNYQSNWLEEVSYGYHVGIDLYSPFGTPVLAFSDGKVTDVRDYEAGKDPEDYWGKMVSILGKDNLLYYYFHFDSVDEKVVKGKQIKAAEKIGTVGKSGFETKDIPPHLHFQIWKFRTKNVNSIKPIENILFLHTYTDGFVINPYHYLKEVYEKR